jgi:beta-carotene 3-hydroxylase
VTGPLLFVLAFVAMEGVSYGAHRWVMHGPGMGWHRSHHAPSRGGFERNDRFPACFSLVGIGLFGAGAVLGAPLLTWTAAGITAYGAAYLVVHEVHIHRRVPAPRLGGRYLTWLREAHADHHTSGGEPYGMLLPLVRDRRRRPVEVARRTAERSER